MSQVSGLFGVVNAGVDMIDESVTVFNMLSDAMLDTMTSTDHCSSSTYTTLYSQLLSMPLETRLDLRGHKLSLMIFRCVFLGAGH